MEKLILLLLIIFSFSFSYSQEKELSKEEKTKRQRNIDAVNPFARFGYKTKIGTLSKGKYLEIQKIDSVVQIGSYRFNQVTGKVAGFVKVDTLYSEATLRPEIISRWFNPDPLSEEFPSWSPYNFVNNNPIYFIDPTGLSPERFMDDYGIDKKGNIELIKKTDDKFDRLYVVDDNGKKKDVNGDGKIGTNDSAKINDQTILPELSEKNINGISKVKRNSSGKKDLFKTFLFASSNTNVEFRIDKLRSNEFVLGTSHNTDFSPNSSDLGHTNKDIFASIHSHPRGNSFSMLGDKKSMGYNIGQNIAYGDWSLYRKLVRNNNMRSPYHYYVYMVDSGRLWRTEYSQPRYIRNIKNNSNRFFFGTLD